MSILFNILTLLFIVVSVALVLIVLVQRPQGGGLTGAFGGGGANEEREDPMRKVFDERNDLGERYEERLKALLTPEQFGALLRADYESYGKLVKRIAKDI